MILAILYQISESKENDMIARELDAVEIFLTPFDLALL